MLVELGRLVRIEWREGRAMRSRDWAPSRGPVLGYETTIERAPLLIVYRPKVIGRASMRGAAAYARTHWGKLGDLNEVEGDTLEGDDLEVLGPCRRVIYATRKGSDELVDYDHVFGAVEGPGGKPRMLRRFTPPEVCTSTSPGVPRGTLQLAGGTYRVTSHGIVG